MIYKSCGNEMYIQGSHIRVSGDDSADRETVVERVLEFVCRNPQCARRGKPAEEAIRLN